MGPEDELSDQAPETADEAEVVPAGPSDSGLDFAPEGAAADAPDEYTPDENAPKVDLSGELAEDAGERASYGFEAASEVPVQGASLPPDELTSMASTTDDSDKFRIQDIPGASDSTGFADDAGEQPHDDTYDPPADEVGDDGVGYVSAARLSDSDEQAPPVEEEAPAIADEAPAVEEAPVEEVASPSPAALSGAAELAEEDEVRAPPRRPDPTSGRAQRPEPAKPAPRAAEASDEPRPGQIRKSALDEIFARAAAIKKQKK